MMCRLIKTTIKPINKICLAGLFIALTIILQKVLAINYISFAPFIRVSFGGPALIMFSSIILGPWYGLLVGAASDLLGYLIFDPRTFAPFFQVTLIYALLGFLSYYIFSFIYSLKSKKTIMLVEISSFVLIWLLISLFVILNDSITLFSSTYEITFLTKILVPLICGILLLGLIFFSFFYKKGKSLVGVSYYQICFASFICDFFIIVLFGSVMKGWAFGFSTYLVILLTQFIVMFVNVVLDTMFISIFTRLAKKYFVIGE